MKFIGAAASSSVSARARGLSRRHHHLALAPQRQRVDGSASPSVKLTVLDTGVVVAGVFWRHEPHACLKAWLIGLICPVVSEDIFDEYGRVLREVKKEQKFTTDIESWLDAMRESALWVTPSALPKPLCRDPHDDRFIEAASLRTREL
jgi:hypothetical protein